MVRTTPTCTEIELAVAKKFNFRQNIIVPNVSWGLGVHECDLLILNKSGYATEVEIKVSKADLKKDKSKKHDHFNRKIKYLWFAIPETLKNCIDIIPEHAGVIIIEYVPPYKSKYISDPHFFFAKLFRAPTVNRHCTKLSDKDILQLTRLGCMRIWGLKEKVIEKNIIVQKNKRLQSALTKKYNKNVKS